MLEITIVDVAERKPVWHGVAEKKINVSDRENIVCTIKAAVGALLSGYTPGKIFKNSRDRTL